VIVCFFVVAVNVRNGHVRIFEDCLQMFHDGGSNENTISALQYGSL
jgi:hypothetical protein